MRLPTSSLSSKLSTWYSKIKHASSEGRWREVLSNYHEMQGSRDQLTDPFIFPLILKACVKLSEDSKGKSVHAGLIKKGFDSFTSIANSIADFYVKGGDFDSAIRVFDSMGSRDSVSWNIIVFGLLDHGFLREGLLWYRKAGLFEFEPNISTLVLAIHACRSLGDSFEGSKLHAQVIKTGVLSVYSVQNSILTMYAEDEMESARKMFDEMPERDIVSWSVMIRGYSACQDTHLGLKMFRELHCEVGIEPDEITIASVLKACVILEDVDIGRSIHGFVINKGFDADLFVANTLVDMYSKRGDANSAFKVFGKMGIRNNVSWNSMLSGFVQNEKYHEALLFFHSMEKEGKEADEVTLVSLLQICRFFGEPLSCKSVHCVIIRQTHETNELVSNSLVDAYANCNLVDLARRVFGRMKKRDVVLWSTMISGLTCCGKTDEAIALFHEMAQETNPNAITIINLLEACSVSADLRKSKWAHGIAIRRFSAADTSIGTSIVDMYAKCGAIETSKRAFDQIAQKNTVSWTAMISAYGMNGLAREALASLEKMKQEDITPNEVTILSALSACSHGGLIKQGLAIFQSMVQDDNLNPSLEHYSCIIDMLSRAGELKTAMELIKNLPEGLKPGASAWGAVLSGCKSYKNNEIGSEAVPEILELERYCSSGYMLAFGMYAARESWDGALAMRRLVKERKVKVVGGYSLVSVGDKARRFVAGETSSGDINDVVGRLHCCMKVEESDIITYVQSNCNKIYISI